MSEFVAVEVVPSSVDTNIGLYEQLHGAAKGLIKYRWAQFSQSFEKHPITSIFLSILVALAFLPIVAAATSSLFIVVFITCAAVFGGLFSIVALQLLLVTALTLLLALLTLLAGGVTVLLVATVIAGQNISLCAARLSSKAREYDWPTLVNSTSACFGTITPGVVQNEVENASGFLKSVPQRELGKELGEGLRVIREKFPFPAMSPASPIESRAQPDGLSFTTAVAAASLDGPSSVTETKTPQAPMTSSPPFIAMVVGFFKVVLSILMMLKASVDEFLATRAYKPAEDTGGSGPASEGNGVTVKVEESEIAVSTSVEKAQGRNAMALSERNKKNIAEE